MVLKDPPLALICALTLSLSQVEIIIFLLGILATRAEPALNVLGRTVEALSGGVFTCKMLIQCVSLGVGVGMAVS